MPAAWRGTVSSWGGKEGDGEAVRFREALTTSRRGGQGRQGAGEPRGHNTLPNGLRTRPVTHAVAARLPGPHCPQRAQRTNAETVSDAPLLEEHIRQTVP